MLWDIIRDWFVQYVWGGYTSNGVSYNGAHLGLFLKGANDTPSLNTQNYYLPFTGLDRGNGEIVGYGLGDWLSTTSTIIVLILLCVFLFLVVRYLFRLTSGLIRGR